MFARVCVGSLFFVVVVFWGEGEEESGIFSYMTSLPFMSSPVLERCAKIQSKEVNYIW